ncbi:MAG: tetratricopeptide repeat protein [Myxococcota bacterium]|jgi:tetratricopeptide (TPR) repeat protein|nr:tetratricopeptide repeat protein [Myxococcota bacterium]
MAAPPLPGLVSCCAVLLLGLLPARGHAQETRPGRQLFAAGIAQEQEQQWELAAALFREVVDDHPGDDLADDALFRLAELSETRLGRPREALTLYQRLLTAHPASRYVRRAGLRVAELAAVATAAPSASLDPAEELAELLAAGERDDELRAWRLEAFLWRQPRFAGWGQAVLALGQLLQSLGRTAEAEGALRWGVARLAAGPPGSEWERRVLAALGELLLDEGRLDEAEVLARRLLTAPDPADRRWGGYLQDATDELRRFRRIGTASLGGVLALSLLLGLASRPWRAPRPLFRLHDETLYLLPVMLLFVAAGYLIPDLPRQVAEAVVRIALGALLYLQASASFLAAWPGPRSVGQRILFLTLPVFVVAALVVGSFERSGLLQELLDTLRDGPEG